MKVFVGGVTGVGKSTLARNLKAAGYNAIDADYEGDISYWADKATGERLPEPVDFSRPRDWKWDGNALARTLGSAVGGHIFILGNAFNQSEFYDSFDVLRVLIADNDTLRRRILARTDNHFGKKPGEMAWVLQQNEVITADLLAAGATAIDATAEPGAVMQTLLESLPA